MPVPQQQGASVGVHSTLDQPLHMRLVGAHPQLMQHHVSAGVWPEVSVPCPEAAVSVPFGVAPQVEAGHPPEISRAFVEPWSAAVLPWPSASDPFPSTAVPWQLAGQSSSWGEEFPLAALQRIAAARQPSQVEIRAQKAASRPLPAKPDPQTGERRHQHVVASDVPSGSPPMEPSLDDVVCIAHFLALFGRSLRLCRRHFDAPKLEEALFDPGLHHPFIARLVRALLSHLPNLELTSSKPVDVFRALTQVLREHVPGEVFPMAAYQPDSRRPIKIELQTPYVLCAIIKALCDLAAEENSAVRSAIDKDIESRMSKSSAAAAPAATAAAVTSSVPAMRLDTGGVRMNRPLGWDSAGRSYYLIQTGDGTASGVRVFSEDPSAPGRIGGGTTTLQAFSVDKLEAAISTLDAHAVVQHSAARQGAAGSHLTGSLPPLATVPAARAAAALRVVQATVAADVAARGAAECVETEDEVEAADAAASAAAKSRAVSPGTNDPVILQHRTRGASKRKDRPGAAASTRRAGGDGSTSDSSSSSDSSAGRSSPGSDTSPDGSMSLDSPGWARQLRSTKFRCLRPLRTSSSSRSSGSASSGTETAAGPATKTAAAGPATKTAAAGPATKTAAAGPATKTAAAAARERRAADRAARLSRAAPPSSMPPPLPADVRRLRPRRETRALLHGAAASLTAGADARVLRSGREARALLNGSAVHPDTESPTLSSDVRPLRSGRKTRALLLGRGAPPLATGPPGGRASRLATARDIGGTASGGDNGGDGSGSSPSPPPTPSSPLASAAAAGSREHRSSPRAARLLAPAVVVPRRRPPLPPPVPPPAGRLPWRWRLCRAPTRLPSPPPHPLPAAGRLIYLAARPQRTDQVTASPLESGASSLSDEGMEETEGSWRGMGRLLPHASQSPSLTLSVSDSSSPSFSASRPTKRQRRGIWKGRRRARRSQVTGAAGTSAAAPATPSAAVVRRGRVRGRSMRGRAVAVAAATPATSVMATPALTATVPSAGVRPPCRASESDDDTVFAGKASEPPPATTAAAPPPATTVAIPPPAPAAAARPPATAAAARPPATATAAPVATAVAPSLPSSADAASLPGTPRRSRDGAGSGSSGATPRARTSRGATPSTAPSSVAAAASTSPSWRRRASAARSPSAAATAAAARSPSAPATAAAARSPSAATTAAAAAAAAAVAAAAAAAAPQLHVSGLSDDTSTEDAGSAWSASDAADSD
ncbi:hypothetical protein MMPV_007054 [Pyropia vietnamensis]